MVSIALGINHAGKIEILYASTCGKPPCDFATWSCCFLASSSQRYHGSRIMIITEKTNKHDAPGLWARVRTQAAGKTFLFAAVAASSSLGLLLANRPASKAFLGHWFEIHWLNNNKPSPQEPTVVRKYELEIGTRWMNPGNISPACYLVV